MPASYLMAWEPKSRRWWKQHNGKRYVISCRQLKITQTKEGSYLAANQWWRSKLAEIEGLREPHPHAAILEELRRRRDRAKALGRTDEADEWAIKVGVVGRLTEPHAIEVVPESYLLSEAARTRREAAILLQNHLEDPIVAEGLYGDDLADLGEPVPLDKTIVGLSRRYLDAFDTRRLVGDLSPGEYALMERCVSHFVDWAGPTNPASVITPHKWEDYWKYLLKRVAAEARFGVVYAKKYWSYARRFIQWMASMGVLALPSNINNKGYKFGDTNKVISTFTLKEVTTLIEKAPGQLKLHLLLMLNCGFYQGDISDLKQTEVDWENGVITRKRSKTRKHHAKAVPTVSWKLWPATFDLLRKYRSDHPTLALTTKQGKAWVEDVIVNGKLKSRDGIQANYRHIQKRLGQKKPLKVFRKTSSSMLDNEAEHGRYAQFFLGQAPDSVAEKHYVVPSQERFDAAVKWLGKQFGF